MKFLGINFLFYIIMMITSLKSSFSQYYTYNDNIYGTNTYFYDDYYPITYYNDYYGGTYYDDYYPITYYNDYYGGTYYDDFYGGTYYDDFYPITYYDDFYGGTYYDYYYDDYYYDDYYYYYDYYYQGYYYNYYYDDSSVSNPYSSYDDLTVTINLYWGDYISGNYFDLYFYWTDSSGSTNIESAGCAFTYTSSYDSYEGYSSSECTYTWDLYKYTCNIKSGAQYYIFLYDQYGDAWNGPDEIFGGSCSTKKGYVEITHNDDVLYSSEDLFEYGYSYEDIQTLSDPDKVQYCTSYSEKEYSSDYDISEGRSEDTQIITAYNGPSTNEFCSWTTKYLDENDENYDSVHLTFSQTNQSIDSISIYSISTEYDIDDINLKKNDDWIINYNATLELYWNDSYDYSILDKKLKTESSQIFTKVVWNEEAYNNTNADIDMFTIDMVGYTCYDDCSGQGTCESGICKCDPEWEGSYCQIPAGWELDAESYEGNDGCDCSAGVWDPDCDEFSNNIMNCLDLETNYIDWNITSARIYGTCIFCPIPDYLISPPNSFDLVTIDSYDPDFEGDDGSLLEICPQTKDCGEDELKFCDKNYGSDASTSNDEGTGLCIDAANSTTFDNTNKIIKSCTTSDHCDNGMVCGIKDDDVAIDIDTLSDTSRSGYCMLSSDVISASENSYYGYLNTDSCSVPQTCNNNQILLTTQYGTFHSGSDYNSGIDCGITIQPDIVDALSELVSITVTLTIDTDYRCQINGTNTYVLDHSWRFKAWDGDNANATTLYYIDGGDEQNFNDDDFVVNYYSDYYNDFPYYLYNDVTYGNDFPYYLYNDVTYGNDFPYYLYNDVTYGNDYYVPGRKLKNDNMKRNLITDDVTYGNDFPYYLYNDVTYGNDFPYYLYNDVTYGNDITYNYYSADDITYGYEDYYYSADDTTYYDDTYTYTTSSYYYPDNTETYKFTSSGNSIYIEWEEITALCRDTSFVIEWKLNLEPGSDSKVYPLLYNENNLVVDESNECIQQSFNISNPDGSVYIWIPSFNETIDLIDLYSNNTCYDVQIDLEESLASSYDALYLYFIDFEDDNMENEIVISDITKSNYDEIATISSSWSQKYDNKGIYIDPTSESYDTKIPLFNEYPKSATFWIKLDGNTSDVIFLSDYKGNSQNDLDEGYITIGLKSTGRAFIDYNGNINAFYGVNLFDFSNDWHHFAFINQNSGYELYIDGVLKSYFLFDEPDEYIGELSTYVEYDHNITQSCFITALNDYIYDNIYNYEYFSTTTYSYDIDIKSNNVSAEIILNFNNEDLLDFEYNLNDLNSTLLESYIISSCGIPNLIESNDPIYLEHSECEVEDTIKPISLMSIGKYPDENGYDNSLLTTKFSMDELQLFSKSLTAEEVFSVMQHYKCDNGNANLIGCYHFESLFPVIEDSSMYRNDGFSVGTSLINSTSFDLLLLQTSFSTINSNNNNNITLSVKFDVDIKKEFYFIVEPVSCPVNDKNEKCSNHGTCDRGICLCDPGYSGEDCSTINTCSGTTVIGSEIPSGYLYLVDPEEKSWLKDLYPIYDTDFDVSYQSTLNCTWIGFEKKSLIDVNIFVEYDNHLLLGQEGDEINIYDRIGHNKFIDGIEYDLSHDNAIDLALNYINISSYNISFSVAQFNSINNTDALISLSNEWGNEWYLGIYKYINNEWIIKNIIENNGNPNIYSQGLKNTKGNKILSITRDNSEGIYNFLTEEVEVIAHDTSTIIDSYAMSAQSTTGEVNINFESSLSSSSEISTFEFWPFISYSARNIIYIAPSYYYSNTTIITGDGSSDYPYNDFETAFNKFGYDAHYMLYPGTYGFNIETSGDIHISSISGSDYTTIKCESTFYSPFDISGKSVSKIEGITFRDCSRTIIEIKSGVVKLNDIQFIENTAAGLITVEYPGILEIEDSIFENNKVSGLGQVNGLLIDLTSVYYIKFKHTTFKNNVFTSLTLNLQVGEANGLIYASNEDTDITQVLFDHCIFENNELTNGGVYYGSTNSAVLFNECKFISNIADEGSNIWANDGTIKIYDCLFDTFNSSASLIDISDVEIDIKNTIFKSNKTNEIAGNIFFYSGEVGTTGEYFFIIMIIFLNCLFAYVVFKICYEDFKNKFMDNIQKAKDAKDKAKNLILSVKSKISKKDDDEKEVEKSIELITDVFEDEYDKSLKKRKSILEIDLDDDDDDDDNDDYSDNDDDDNDDDSDNDDNNNDDDKNNTNEEKHERNINKEKIINKKQKNNKDIDESEEEKLKKERRKKRKERKKRRDEKIKRRKQKKKKEKMKKEKINTGDIETAVLTNNENIIESTSEKEEKKEYKSIFDSIFDFFEGDEPILEKEEKEEN